MHCTWCTLLPCPTTHTSRKKPSRSLSRNLHMAQGTFPEGLQGELHLIVFNWGGVYLPSSLSSLLSHLPRPTSWGTKHHSILGYLIQLLRSLPQCPISYLQRWVSSISKGVGPTRWEWSNNREKESSNYGTLRSHTRHVSQCNLIKTYLGEELIIHSLPED